MKDVVKSLCIHTGFDGFVKIVINSNQTRFV